MNKFFTTTFLFSPSGNMNTDTDTNISCLTALAALPHLPTYLQKTFSTIQKLNRAVSQFLRCFLPSFNSSAGQTRKRFTSP